MFLPLSLLSLLTPVFSAQYPIHVEAPVTVQSTSLIDALSADGNYTRLIRLIQRARLVPTLNRLNGSTLFAPTNDAIERQEIWKRASDTDEREFHAFADNIKEQLRQQLLYHVLNYSIAELPQREVQIHKTLHFPRKPIDPPTREPPPNPPWLPIPGGTLGGEPQRLRVAGKDGKALIGTDFAGNGGIQVTRPIVEASNGQLIGVDGLLEPPANLSHIILNHPSLSYFRRILSEPMIEALANTPAVTLFLPQDPAWLQLNEVERLYLESSFSDDDVRKIIEMHSVVKKGIHWSDTWKDSPNLTTVNGNKLTIEINGDNDTTIAGAKVLQPDIYSSNGVIHLVDDLLIPLGAFQLTPEKYLLALNCSSFVSLLRSVSLSPLVNNTDSPYTILAPRDDVITLMGDGKLPEPGSTELARLLKYHFLPGQWNPKKLKDGMLVQTALEESGLNGGKQVLGIGVTSKGEDPELTFGGAGVIGGKPLEFNNTIIYLITRPLTPPQDALAAALPSLQFSVFLAAVFSSSLSNKLGTAKSTTLLIPRNTAFEQLGLVTTHLLLSSSKPDLEKVIQHHVVTEVAYADQILNGSRKAYPTLEDSDIQVDRLANGSVFFEPSGGWDGLRGQIGSGQTNILTRTGVIHEISGVMLPRTLEITIEKLANAAKGSTMASLAVKAGMGWVLNGTAPPAGSEWADAGIKGGGWTLLCPTDASFKGVNMTLLWSDVPAMRKLVEQHLIPAPSAGDIAKSEDPNRPLLFDGKATYSTLLSKSSLYGDVVFRLKNEKNLAQGYIVGIKDARGTNKENDWANVVSWGRSTQGSTGGVVQIDRLLLPYEPAWWIEYGPPVMVGVLGVGLIGAFFWGLRWLWRRDNAEATYEPVGGFDREDDD